MITIMDMAITFIKNNINTRHSDLINSYLFNLLEDLSFSLDIRFFKDIKNPERSEFEEYVEYFLTHSDHEIFEEMQTISREDSYFKELVYVHYIEYMRLFRERYNRAILLKLYNLKNKKRNS